MCTCVYWCKILVPCKWYPDNSKKTTCYTILKLFPTLNLTHKKSQINAAIRFKNNRHETEFAAATTLPVAVMWKAVAALGQPEQI